MSVTIHLPAAINMLLIPPSLPAANLVADGFRAATIGIKDVQSRVEGRGAPDWMGESAEAADHATTAFARRLAVPEEALLRAATAADTYVQDLRELGERRLALFEREKHYNADLEKLTGEIDTGAATADEAQVQLWRASASRLTGTRALIEDAVTQWHRDCDAANDGFVAALAAVDTVEEAQQAATAPGRPDVDALLRTFAQRRSDPEALNAWWKSLTDAEREALMTEHPELVGNADGIPVAARDDANRGLLARDHGYLTEREHDGQLSEDERAILDNVNHIITAMEDQEALVDPATGESLMNVIVYKPGAHSGDGGIAISLGNPDTADHVSTFVPGLTNDTSTLGGNLDSIRDLYDAAADKNAGSVATVFWLDYDAPSGDFSDRDEVLDFGGVVGPGRAHAGGENFADFIDGLRASDEGDRAHLTAIGHSYGSTTVGHGLREGADVDEAVLIGSPGQPVAHASDLTDADVWVGSNDRDPVTLLGSGPRGGIGALGYDPSADSFGGTRFTTDEGSYRVEDLLKNHSSYFKGDSLGNMADIMVDNPGGVETEEGRNTHNYETLDELLLGSTAASGIEKAYEIGHDVAESSIERGQELYGMGRDAVEAGVGAARDLGEGALNTGRDVAEGFVDTAEGVGGWVGDRWPW